MQSVHVLAAKALIGDPVKGRRGVELGEVADILVNPETSKVDYAIVSLYQLEKQFAVPFPDLSLIGEEGYCHIDVEADEVYKSQRTINFCGKNFYSI